MWSVLRWLSSAALVLVAAASPLMGFAAAEEYEGRRFFGVLEGDWFALFGVVAGTATLWSAVRLALGPRRAVAAPG